MSTAQIPQTHRTRARTTRLIALIGIGVVIWVCATGWGGMAHGHPAYGVLVGVTLLWCIAALVSAGTRELRTSGRRTVGRIALMLLALAWLALICWLRPHTATEPSLTAMESDAAVTVTETATSITLAPTEDAAEPGVFFQPGALVDARAYAAVLRSLAGDGHTVVIAKQPLGIAFLAQGAFDTARSQHPEIAAWVLGGHSLGGTVAAATASEHADSEGLLLFASYPASDIEATAPAVLSISGSADGLATPAKIEASRANLPQNALFIVIEGASHAQFGDYGPQAGDGTPAIANDAARDQISAAAREFVDSLSPH